MEVPTGKSQATHIRARFAKHIDDPQYTLHLHGPRSLAEDTAKELEPEYHCVYVAHMMHISKSPFIAAREEHKLVNRVI